MDTPPEPIRQDLQRLRKGRGVWSENVSPRLGVELRQLCGIEPVDDEAGVRDKLLRRLDVLADRLPGDLRLAAKAALAILPGTKDMRYLEARIGWLAEQQGCSDRTARRRVNDALDRLAAEAVRELNSRSDATGGSDEGWYVESLRTHLSLDRPSPQSFEVRRIVATTDGLDEIIHRANLPRYPNGTDRTPTLDIEILYGGKPNSWTSSGRHFQYVVSLPAPLKLYEHHEYSVLMRVSEAEAMAPQYVCLPLRRHDLFELKVQFDPAMLPREIWRLDGVPPRAVDDRMATEAVLVPNRLGEVEARFRNLRIGFGYGIQWSG